MNERPHLRISPESVNNRNTEFDGGGSSYRRNDYYLHGKTLIQGLRTIQQKLQVSNDIVKDRAFLEIRLAPGEKLKDRYKNLQNNAQIIISDVINESIGYGFIKTDDIPSRFSTVQKGGSLDETYELDLYNSNVQSKATYLGTIFGTVTDLLEIIQGQLWVSQYVNNVKQSHVTVNSNAINYFHGTTFEATGKIQFDRTAIDISSFAELIASRITMDARTAQRSVRFNAGTGGEAGIYGSNSGTGQGRVGAYDWGLGRHIFYYERGDNTFNVVPTAKFGEIFTEPWTAPGLSNGWAQYGGTYPYAGYLKQTDGLVVLRGAIKGGTLGATIFTLPVGYRPQYDQAFPGVDNNNVQCTVIVRSNGVVSVQQGIGYSVNTAFISLEGVRFQTKAG